MTKGKIIGLSLFAGGIILLAIYVFYLTLQEISFEFDVSDNIIFAISTGAILIGIIVLIISVFFEQRSDTKKIKEEIKKEDFEP